MNVSTWLRKKWNAFQDYRLQREIERPIKKRLKTAEKRHAKAEKALTRVGRKITKLAVKSAKLEGQSMLEYERILVLERKMDALKK